jgi:hypothetical protein
MRPNNYMGSIMEGKTEGKASRGRLRDKYLGQDKKETRKKSHREVKELGRSEGLQYTNPRIVILY